MTKIGFGKGDENIGKDVKIARRTDGGYETHHTYTHTEIDFPKLQSLPIEGVLRDIGGWYDDPSGRWSMPGETHTGPPKIHIRGDGTTWTHYKTGTGGDAICLIRFWQCGNYDTNQNFSASGYVDAANWLAARYDAYISYKKHFESSRKNGESQAALFENCED